ncbi:MAG: iron-containing alcohol dehydrogenase [Sedimentisphaerales bacterium]|nr:iron-containing alcohol dehydrogenase [Sedimentisphaerales bacterium]
MEIQNFVLNWPGKVIFGSGKIAALADEAKILGKRVLVITTKDLSNLGFTERATTILKSAGLAVDVFDDVQPDPTCVAADAVARIARSNKDDVIVAFGGGSAIDLSKAVSVAVRHEGPIWDYVTYTGANAKPVTSAVLPLIAIPTTAGTGSEVSMGTVLDNPEKHMKAALLSPYVFPRVAIVDPELTYSLPSHITAMTGFDALTHGIESYLNVSRSNPASELLALDAVRRVVRYLPQVVENGNNHEARAQMSWAATVGGVAMALSNVTVAHAMGLPLGSRAHVPHGLGLSRLLPVVMEYSWQAQPRRYAEVAEVVGAAKQGMNDGEKAQALVQWLKDFVRNIGLMKLWAGYAVDEKMLQTLTADVFAYMGRPVQQHLPVFTPEQVREIYAAALIKEIDYGMAVKQNL